MRVVLSVLALAVLVVVAYAGECAKWWDIDDARVASEIEIKISKNGDIQDVEYHISPSLVPPAVTKGMDDLYQGILPIAAEKEYEAGELFYELAVEVGPNNLKHEVMFTPEGEVHSKEIQVEETDPAYTLLPEIKTGLLEKYPGADDLVFEVILDPGDNLVEFHVKLTMDKGTPDEKHYKLIVTKLGFLAGAYLEVDAEIEVPISPR